MDISNNQELDEYKNLFSEKINQRDIVGLRDLNHAMYESVFQGYTQLIANRERFENMLRNVAVKAPDKLNEAERDIGGVIEQTKVRTNALMKVLNDLLIIESKMIDLQLRIEQK